MLNRDYEGQNCSIARALEIVGERWTLLIIRDVLLGLHRFDEFQESLGIARNVLTDRLNRLVDEGVLERVLYSERPERYEYHLTKKGLDLNVALMLNRDYEGQNWETRPAGGGCTTGSSARVTPFSRRRTRCAESPTTLPSRHRSSTKSRGPSSSSAIRTAAP